MWRLAIGVLTLLVLTGCSSMSVYKSKENSYKQNDLMRAVYYQDVKKVKELAQDSSLLKETDVRGANILHYAAKYGTEEIVRYLLELDTKELLTDKGGVRNNTPLQEALIEGNQEAAMLFYQSTPSEKWNQVDPDGHTLLHLAYLSGDDWIVTQLLEQGVSPNIQDEEGNTPFQDLLYCFEQNICSEYNEGLKQSTQQLVKFGLNPYIENKSGVNAYSVFEPYLESSTQGWNNLKKNASEIQAELQDFFPY